MSRNSDKKGLNGSNGSNGSNNHRKNAKISPRYRSSRNPVPVTEDERLLRRPTQPLVGPTEQMPQEQVQEERHAQERAFHFDYTLTDPWRVFRIMSEFVEGFDALAHIPPSVAIFGSARLKPETPAYVAAEETALLLARAGFGIITGGGPGIMEAANKGAQEAGGISIGLPMESLAGEQPNRFQDLSLVFRYFVARKTMFVKHAEALVIFPGGFGTLDELFEALVLVQTRKVHPFPIILYGKAFWSGLLTWMRDTLATAAKTIDPGDPDLLCVSDHPQEVVGIVEEAYRANTCRDRPPSLYRSSAARMRGVRHAACTPPPSHREDPL